MRIPPKAPPLVRRARSAETRSRPAEHGASASAPPPASPSPAAPTASVATLVALAAIDDARDRRRREAKQAEAGLEALEALDAELAAGGVSEDRLREIAEWSAGLTRPEDPHLAAILADIDLRAQVELAKHDRARRSGDRT